MADKEYDLTAASLMFGKLIDPREQERIRRERVRSELVEWARVRCVRLKPSDIEFDEDAPLIGGMPAADWLEGMTEERP